MQVAFIEGSLFPKVFEDYDNWVLLRSGAKDCQSTDLFIKQASF